MRLGIFDHIDASGAPIDQQLNRRLDLVEIYDATGVDTYHLAEHHSTPLGMASAPSVFLAAVAQRTKRIKFGPLVYILPLHHPLRLIEEICLLDQLSGGRFQLGVGPGGGVLEQIRFGFDESELAPRYTETLDILLTAFGSEVLNYEGRFYTLRDVPMLLRPLQRPHPPIWYGTTSPGRAAWAADNRVNLLSLLPPAMTRKISDAYRDEWSARGHSAETMPACGVTYQMVVAETDAEARAIASRAWKVFRSSYNYLWRRDDRSPSVRISDDLGENEAAGRVVIGSPETVIAKLRSIEEVAGINYLGAELVFGDMSWDEARRAAELFGTLVVPAISGLSQTATIAKSAILA
jgi:alkanesulfonate monooxygenase SsuD/methylene tetrahydromethanopterin reductase-like flavin-dependent oxidoreductase (luciferase family)